jgi:fatty-acyl-CoA synthase/benzoate-CoA ligase/fatty acid CoA ligase FadD22
VTAHHNLAAVLERAAYDGGWADDVAFVDGARTVTHGEVYDGAARTAAVLASSGVDRGDAVLLALPDTVELVWAFLGAVRLGAVAVLVNPRLTTADHCHLAADVAARVVVCCRDLAERFAGRPVIVADELRTLLPDADPAPPADVVADDVAYAQYTSGTTGVPKAALHAHADPRVYFDAFARGAIALTRDDVVLSVSKLYFAYGLGNALFFPLLAGCRAVLVAGRPTPTEITALVARHRVTVLYSVPTFYAHLAAEADPAALRSIRVAVSAGEALTPALAARARDVLGCPVLDGIGSTEVGQTFASNTVDEWRDGTVGRALPPYRVGVRTSSGRPAAPGRVGDLWVAGPTLLLGYLGEARRADRQDWLRTGDRAVIDTDGFLRLRGRADDVELVGGISVSPLEIEAVLSRHPAVTEVAVAGVALPNGASRLQAFVVPAPDTARDGSVAAELVELARAELAPFKVPRSVAFVDALPRTATGKLRRFVLRSGRWAGVAAQVPTSPPNASS